MLSDAVNAARERAEFVTIRAAFWLPPHVQRLLAGRPIARDGQTLDLEAQLLLRLMRLGGREGAQFGPHGRSHFQHETRLVSGAQPIGDVRELKVDGAAGLLPARLYVPRALLTRSDGDPLLVFFHGGAWVVGDLDSHDGLCRVIAERAGIRVLAVDYRLAPEAPFPAAPDDCAAAYRWVVENVAELGADVERLAVGGDSAGGNLAALTALRAAEEGLPLKHQLLVYPATDFTHSTASHGMFDRHFYLTREAMESGRSLYLGDHDRRDPAASPLHATVPAGLAPAYVVTGGFDPLRDEGEAYARKLADAGVQVELHRVTGQIHGFFNIVGLGPDTRAAVEEIVDRLGAALHAI